MWVELSRWWCSESWPQRDEDEERKKELSGAKSEVISWRLQSTYCKLECTLSSTISVIHRPPISFESGSLLREHDVFKLSYGERGLHQKVTTWSVTTRVTDFMSTLSWLTADWRKQRVCVGYNGAIASAHLFFVRIVARLFQDSFSACALFINETADLSRPGGHLTLSWAKLSKSNKCNIQQQHSRQKSWVISSHGGKITQHQSSKCLGNFVSH